ncbi:hypothetical protein [Pelagicoccus albus]|uniref:Uncharacterized protein n=1 Tax=Pelagicoccus albus TaxID=415222 RepID=A0A7X1EBN6_9BACT|nr:hypothetical protein [Pelagicoccus albus]MBC2608002.1 hypothetical protein [Pelagicoccus albus]
MTDKHRKLYSVLHALAWATAILASALLGAPDSFTQTLPLVAVVLQITLFTGKSRCGERT